MQRSNRSSLLDVSLLLHCIVRQLYLLIIDTMTQPSASDDVDNLLRQIRDSLLLHPVRGGAVKIVIESETGEEEIHVLKVDYRYPPSPKMTPRPPAPQFVVASTSSLQRDAPNLDDDIRPHQQQQQELLQRCEQQALRIAELEMLLQQRALPSSSPISHSQLVSPAVSTDDDDISSGSSSSDSPLRASDGEADEDGHGAHDDAVAMTDDADDASKPSSCSLPSSDSTAVRKSERSKNNVDRWKPTAEPDAPCQSAGPASSRKKRKTKRHQRSRHDDGDQHSDSSDVMSLEVDSGDNQSATDGADDDDAVKVEVTALVTKLREGYDRRQSVALDSLSKESVLSLCQQVLEEAGDRVASIFAQITALISTSASLRMVGYYLRAVLAHRLKRTSQNCYTRLARDKLGIMSSVDIAAYPALYELVQHHYPTLASADIETWLENPLFSADITWTEWKRYLTKQGRPIIDVALQQFKASVAPFQDWLDLGWVEIYDDERLSGQGVRALRDIHMPKSKAKGTQRDLEAFISVVAVDLHSAGPEFVKVKEPTQEVDPEYLIGMDQQRVFDARRHWIGKINHLPMPHCNLKITGNGKLVQIKPIKAGEVLTLDYGMEYWVHQVTGLDLSEWLSEGSSVCQRGRMGLFTRMYESVLDYSKLLQEKWADSLSCLSSAVEREGLLVELEDHLDAADC